MRQIFTLIPLPHAAPRILAKFQTFLYETNIMGRVTLYLCFDKNLNLVPEISLLKLVNDFIKRNLDFFCHKI